MRTRAARHIGFTLIELLIAAAIIALLLAVIVPSYLSSLQKRDARREPAAQLAQGALSAAARAGGKALRTERTDVRVRLQAFQVLEDLKVHTEYDAAFSGAFTLRSEEPGSAEIDVHFAFPPGVSEARDVSLQLRG